MEKFVLTPIKVFDKIAKYSPENANIDLLIEADDQKERIQNAKNLDPVTKSFLSSLKLKDVELNRRKVFPQNEKTLPINQAIPKPNVADKSTGSTETQAKSEHDDDGKDDDENLPPLNSSVAETIGPDQKYILSLLEKDPNFELYDNNTFRIGKKVHRNIYDTLNHITRSRTSQRLKPVDGTEAVIRAIATNNDKFNINKISLRPEIQNRLKIYKKKSKKMDQVSTKQLGGGSEETISDRNLVFIDKLPFYI